MARFQPYKAFDGISLRNGKNGPSSFYATWLSVKEDAERKSQHGPVRTYPLMRGKPAGTRIPEGMKPE